MGALKSKVESDLSSTTLSLYYKDNTNNMYNLYQNPKDGVESISISELSEGGFYMLMYKDDSNWMKFSPIFLVDFKKFEDKTILYGINFNFIPLEVRVGFFDKYLKNLSDDNQLTNINFETVYKELLKIGYEYSITEYNISRILRVYKIGINILHTFLYSSWPTNKYDPKKLYDIWVKKLETKEKRHQSIITKTIEDFYDISKSIEGEVDILKGRIDRIQRGEDKYGK